MDRTNSMEPGDLTVLIADVKQELATIPSTTINLTFTMPLRPVGRVYAPSHTQKIFNPKSFRHLIDRLEERITELLCDTMSGVEFDALAGSGNSGLMVLGALSDRLKMPVLTVRKTMDTNHDHRMVNGYLVDGMRYLIIDDLIASGRTIDRIVKNITTESREVAFGSEGAQPAGILTYYSNYGSFYTTEFDQIIPTFFVAD